MNDNLNIQDSREFQEDEHILEILTKISQRCKTEEEGKQAKNHCMDILRYNSWLLESEVFDTFFKHEGVVNSFEISIANSEENRVAKLIDQIRVKTSNYGAIKYLMANFFVSSKTNFRLRELSYLGDLFESSPQMKDETDVWWQVSKDENNDNQIRAIVLVMHQN